MLTKNVNYPDVRGEASCSPPAVKSSTNIKSPSIELYIRGIHIGLMIWNRGVPHGPCLGVVVTLRLLIL
ncbi:hypothetical protein HS7_20030 [Sulfolobales archaeon HS-7]|nr:hypothetical protein HS7_20030 [Sulfolobales archaeon HS-7]